MKRNMIMIGAIASILLMVSCATAVPTIQWNQQEKSTNQKIHTIIERIQNHPKLDNIRNNIHNSISQLVENYQETTSLTEKIQILITILFKWPFQGIANVFTYAFIENSLIPTLLDDVKDFELTEKITIIFTVLLRCPVQALINIFTYAFIDNSFFASLISELPDNISS